MSDLASLVANRQMPDDARPNVTLGEIREALDAARAEPGASEGLRAALHDLQDWLIHPDRAYSPHEIAMYAHDRIAAALAASPSSGTHPDCEYAR